jgi:hypothetical protein
MAYTYRSNSSQGNGSGLGLTVNKPAGTADGDLIVVVGYLESDTNTWSSVGSGFTEVKNIDNTGLFDLRMWYKWASGEPASWTWTPSSSNWRTVLVASYSGGSGSGTQPDVSSSDQADGSVPQSAPSVTTTVNDDVLVFGYGNFQGNNPSGVTGAATNLRVTLGGTALSDANFATAGATGISDASGVGSADYAAVHVAFLLTGSGGGGGGDTTIYIRHPV